MCLSLWQPWAALVALGQKRWETRGWSTSYRGWLLIHAARKWTPELQALRYSPPFKEALLDHKLAFGAAIGVCKLMDCVRTEMARRILTPTERAFGDYSDQRYAWRLHKAVLFPKPILMVGHQKLWACDDATRAQIIAWGLLG